MANFCSFVVGEYLSDAAASAASAAKVGQEAVVDAAKVTKEYAAAGAQKTQDALNDYVRLTAEATMKRSGCAIFRWCPSLLIR